ncbi:MAG: ADP-forming succinate--CoA ligase subunit beta, partial [Gammaproteobacteria bacterium]|nr:ADP-forming succinate--CoA ligase subunit beta [Gammaproteobacteria bacterium]
TPQTVAEGLPINVVFVEEGSDIDRELYFSMLVDRDARRVVMMVSSAGGMNIEEVAEKTPDKIMTVEINPATGLMPYQSRLMAFALQLDKKQVRQFSKIADSLYKLFIDKDASLLEINPLITTGSGDVMALDAKINIEDNALFRQPGLLEWRDPTQEDDNENSAAAHGLNYVSLDGDIACMVNGAGLAMATMDLIKLHGGEPANFLDVGGGATAERVAEAFKIILSNSNVRAILVNIFGGIVRCDLIAEGVVTAVREVGVKIPVVVRLEGTNVEKGRALLANCDIDIVSADDLTDAAKKVIKAAG